jgi:hypothetical protein
VQVMMANVHWFRDLPDGDTCFNPVFRDYGNKIFAKIAKLISGRNITGK